jgi:hypothetical protein
LCRQPRKAGWSSGGAARRAAAGSVAIEIVCSGRTRTGGGWRYFITFYEGNVAVAHHPRKNISTPTDAPKFPLMSIHFREQL